MEDFDYWRLCEDLSIIQATLLTVGENPAGRYAYVENMNLDKKPEGYQAVRTAITNALKRNSIDGKLCFTCEYDQHGSEIEGSPKSLSLRHPAPSASGGGPPEGVRQ